MSTATKAAPVASKEEGPATSAVALNLAAINVPVPEVKKGKGWVLWGDNHKFMREVLGYIKKSPTASAMLNRKASFIAGEGFKVDAKEYPKLKEWLKNVAPEKAPKLTANNLLKRLSKDAAKLEAFAFQVAWDAEGKFVAGLQHQRIETVACGDFNEDGKIDTYFLCRDWSKTNKYPPVQINAYNPATAKADKVQLFVYVEEQPGQEYYPDLSFSSSLPYMSAEARLAVFTDNNVKTRFTLSAIFKILRGPKDKTLPDGTVLTAEQQRKLFEEGIKKKFSGEDGEAILTLWGPSESGPDAAEKMADVETVSVATGETYESVKKLCTEGILSSGQVTSPVVVGLPGEGGLGGNGSEIREAYEMYNNTVCRPWQLALMEALIEIAQHRPGLEALEFDPDAPALDIISSMPVKQHFSEDTLAGVLDDDEIRAAEDYGPRKKPDEGAAGEVVQTEAQKALAGSVGGQTAIDAMLEKLAQRLATRESCIARLKTFFGLSQEQAESIVPNPDDLAPLPAAA